MVDIAMEASDSLFDVLIDEFIDEFIDELREVAPLLLPTDEMLETFVEACDLAMLALFSISSARSVPDDQSTRKKKPSLAILSLLPNRT